MASGITKAMVSLTSLFIKLHTYAGLQAREFKMARFLTDNFSKYAEIQNFNFRVLEGVEGYLSILCQPGDGCGAKFC